MRQYLMGKSQRDKGARRERELVNKHRAAGIRSERVPLSGGAHYKGEGHDIDVYPVGRDAPLVVEVKARGNGSGFKTITDWLGENDALFLMADRSEPLAVVPWRIWIELISQSARGCEQPGGGRSVGASQPVQELLMRPESG
jgi:hypothetical protein